MYQLEGLEARLCAGIGSEQDCRAPTWIRVRRSKSVWRSSTAQHAYRYRMLPIDSAFNATPGCRCIATLPPQHASLRSCFSRDCSIFTRNFTLFSVSSRYRQDDSGRGGIVPYLLRLFGELDAYAGNDCVCCSFMAILYYVRICFRCSRMHVCCFIP